MGRKHRRLAIIKKWSDMKRRQPRCIKRIRDEKCPEIPIPSIRRRRSVEVVEVEAEEEEEAGPSQPIEPTPPDVGEVKEVESAVPSRTTPSQDSEEEEMITSPRQEGMKTLNAKLAKMQREHHQDMRAIQERFKAMEESQRQTMKGTFQNKSHVSLMFFHRVREDQDIVQIDDYKLVQKISEDIIDKMLKSGWGIAKTKRHNEIFEMSIS
ncbi:uncharacterized protein LOC120990921 [Bufo bufo]|uniref:uncharacterized protein LOC120990921 n=1 Tax=Bufo bufo TaxID=8384 RepID=UPI001ABE56B2|nr:uncharacterized protein LOC120990921 [Bufo bufo]